MRHLFSRFFIAAAVLTAGSSFLLTARADDAPTTAPSTAPAAGVGSIKGTVLKDDGSAFLGSAEVKLLVPMPKHPKPADAPAGDSPEKPAPKKGTVVKTLKITPEDKGIFEFKDVPAGRYGIQVSDKADNLAGKAKVTVTADSEAEVTVTLKAPKPKKPAGETPGAPIAPANPPAQ